MKLQNNERDSNNMDKEFNHYYKRINKIWILDRGDANK